MMLTRHGIKTEASEGFCPSGIPAIQTWKMWMKDNEAEEVLGVRDAPFHHQLL